MKRKIITTIAFAAALCSANFCMGFKFVNQNAETRYCGGITFTTRTETINYVTKDKQEKMFQYEVPGYTKQGAQSSCANIAGAIAIGYYDRFYENLIPDFVSYMQIGPVLMYKSGGLEVEALINSLHYAMGTDVGGAGTTFEGFQNGMKSYVNGQGYTYQNQDLGSFDFEKFKTAIENDKPVALFLDDFSLKITGEDNGSREIIKSDYCNTPHVAIAYGYRIETYYNANNQVITTRTYLKVASGLINYRLTHLCLDGKSTIDRAVAISIS